MRAAFLERKFDHLDSVRSHLSVLAKHCAHANFMI